MVVGANKPSSAAEDIEGTISCKVKSVSVTKMEDGVPKVYSGYKDGLSKNDQVLFHYLS